MKTCAICGKELDHGKIVDTACLENLKGSDGLLFAKAIKLLACLVYNEDNGECYIAKQGKNQCGSMKTIDCERCVRLYLEEE